MDRSLTPAPFSSRLLAFCVDLGIIYGILSIVGTLAMLLAIPFVLFAIGTTLSVPEELRSLTAAIGISLALVALMCILAIQNVYFVFSEGRYGTTLGKRIFNLRVVSNQHTSITITQAAIRDLMRFIDCFLVIPGLVSVLATDQNRRFGDFLAGTIVVRTAPVLTPPLAIVPSPPLPTLESLTKPPSLTISDLSPGGFWRRTIALLIDGCVLSVFMLPFDLVISIASFTALNDTVSWLLLPTILRAASIVLCFFYFALFYQQRGATPGKLIMGLKVIDADTGRHIGPLKTLVREFIGKFIGIVTLGVGFLVAGFRQDRRALHDFLANTRVVRVYNTSGKDS